MELKNMQTFEEFITENYQINEIILFKFNLTDPKMKTIFDFFKNPNGLSRSVHKGYLLMIPDKDKYKMEYVENKKSEKFKSAVAWAEYPIETKDDIHIEDVTLKKYL